MPKPSLRWLAPAALLLALAAAGEVLTSEPPASSREILQSLFRSIPADDFDYDAGERLARLQEALDALRAATAEDAGAASCNRYCDDRSTVLENSCGVMLQPSAARSRAVCHARVVEMNAQCRAGCRR